MIDHLEVTELADNYTAVSNLLAEHGLSMLIEADDRRILFDTGQGRVLCSNAGELGIVLSGLDAVVLSHGHYDHTGGWLLCCGNLPRQRSFYTRLLCGRNTQRLASRRTVPSAS